MYDESKKMIFGKTFVFDVSNSKFYDCQTFSDSIKTLKKMFVVVKDFV